MVDRKVKWAAGAGVAWLAVFACVFTFVPVSTSSSTTTSRGPDGAEVVVEETTSRSTWESDPKGASTLLVGVIGSALVTYALVRWGRGVGPVLVLATVGPASLLIMLSQALFFAPGMQLLCAAAILALAGRAEQRRLRPPPPPPGYRAADAVTDLDT